MTHGLQDTAKTFYDVTPDTALLDLNRAGTGLIELVTHPDLRSSTDASAFVTKLQGVLRALGASHASLEEVRPVSAPQMHAVPGSSRPHTRSAHRDRCGAT